MKTIYQAKRITKFLDRYAVRGDSNFVEWGDSDDAIFPLRFFLEDVIAWEVYADYIDPFKTNKQVLVVTVVQGGGRDEFFIIEDLDVFDLLMEEIHKQNETNNEKS